MIQQRPTASLRLHELQERIPAPDTGSPSWQAMLDSIAEHGVMQPLIITEDGRIMDGGWRWRAATQVHLDSVPCTVAPDTDAAFFITHTILHRKLMSRGAAVYLVIKFDTDLVEAAKVRSLKNLKKGQVSPTPSNLESGKISVICRRLGVSDETYIQAKKVHAIFDANPELRDKYEPKLLSGEFNLWNVTSACGGTIGTEKFKGTSPKDFARSPLRLFAEVYGTFTKRMSYWANFTPAEKSETERLISASFSAAPDDLLKAHHRAIKSELRRRTPRKQRNSIPTDSFPLATPGLKEAPSVSGPL